MQARDEALLLRIPLGKMDAKRPSPRVEISRSFSFKLNVGNFQTRDFFCSQKAECDPEEAEATSERLHDFCKGQVLKAVREYQARREP